MKQGRLMTMAILALFALIFVIGLSNSLFVTINPGEKGVLFKRFGGGLQVDKTYSQGFHVIAPWNDMIVYDLRIQEAFEKAYLTYLPTFRLS